MQERYSAQETKILRKLNTPAKVQDFLETLRFNFEEKGETCMSPRRVLQTKKAHCMEGALFAAAALEHHGHKPLVVDLRATKDDFDHVLAVYRLRGFWGALSKTNHGVLRYREPIYKTIRELVMSCFHEYFDHSGKKNLREYSGPINLNRFNGLSWRTSNQELFAIPHAIDRIRHISILSSWQLKNLRRADPVEIATGKLVQWRKKKIR